MVQVHIDPDPVTHFN